MDFYNEVMTAYGEVDANFKCFQKFSYDFFFELQKHIAGTYGLPERGAFIKFKAKTAENINIIEECVYFEKEYAIYRIGMDLGPGLFQSIHFALCKADNVFKLVIDFSLEFSPFEKQHQEIVALKTLNISPVSLKPINPDFTDVDKAVKGTIMNFLTGIKNQYSIL